MESECKKKHRIQKKSIDLSLLTQVCVCVCSMRITELYIEYTYMYVWKN